MNQLNFATDMSLLTFLPESEPNLVKYGHLIIERKILKESILYSVQKEALKSVIDWFSNPEKLNSTAVVVMPAGTGKTGVIACLPFMLGWAVKEKRVDIELSKPILVIAPGLTILHQLEENICHDEENVSPFLVRMKILEGKDRKLHYRTCVIDNADAIKNLNAMEGVFDVVLSNAQKWRNKAEKYPNYAELNNDLFSAVIVDEAHHLPSAQWKRIMDHFKGHAKIIFFTATPIRHDGKEITSDRALSLRKDYTYYLRRTDAIRDRLIREVKFNCKRYKQFDKGNIKLGVLKAIKFKLEEKNTNYPLPGGFKHTAIVITKEQQEADEVYALCSRLSGVKAKLVHSRIKESRENLIRDIKKGGYDLVIVVAMLLEGFDYPPLSVAGILTKIQSRVKFAQFVGRIQRIVRSPDIENENIVGDIITAPVYEQRDLYEQYENPTIAEYQDLDS